jgi:hypothetical protein
MRPVVGERVKGRRNADLCAADFCRFAGQGLRLGKSPLRFPAVAGLEQRLADYQPSLEIFQQADDCLIQWKPPRFEGKLPGISFPDEFFAICFSPPPRISGVRWSPKKAGPPFAEGT